MSFRDCPGSEGLPSVMSTQRVTITYSGPIIFLSTDHWKQIYASLASQLPLRNLHWKSTNRNALRSIQELDVKLVSLETLREDQAASQVPQTVLDKPLLNLYIFICEVNATSSACSLGSQTVPEGQ